MPGQVGDKENLESVQNQTCIDMSESIFSFVANFMSQTSAVISCAFWLCPACLPCSQWYERIQSIHEHLCLNSNKKSNSPST